LILKYENRLINEKPKKKYDDADKSLVYRSVFSKGKILLTRPTIKE